MLLCAVLALEYLVVYMICIDNVFSYIAVPRVVDCNSWHVKTLWKFNIAAEEKLTGPKRTTSLPSISFQGFMLNFGGVYIFTGQW